MRSSVKAGKVSVTEGQRELDLVTLKESVQPVASALGLDFFSPLNIINNIIYYIL